MLARSRAEAESWGAAILACLLVTTIPLLTHGQSATPPQAGTGQTVGSGQAATGTARVTVQVVATETGKPVKRARIALFGMPTTPSPAASQPGAQLTNSLNLVVQGGRGSGSGPPPNFVQRQGQTDQRGRVEFTGLPAGRFTLSASAPSGYYFPQQQPAPVDLREGATETITLRFERTGAITGRVLDEDGDPIEGATVQALLNQTVAGSTRTTSSGRITARTDDLGQYRVYSLLPGEYAVVANYVDMQGPPVQAASRLGYLPTYYPGAVAYHAAESVAVHAGQDTAVADFMLARGRLGSVSGTATDSNGTPLTSSRAGGATLTLVPRARMPGWSGRGASLQPNGAFTISDVPPGEYYLGAQMMTMSDQPGAPREGAYVPVEVNGDDVRVNIQTNTGATISGRVVVEGTAAETQPGTPVAVSRPAPVRVMVVSAFGLGGTAPGVMSAPGQPSSVGEDGTFTLTGVRGHVHITATGVPLAFKGVTQGGRDISGVPLELVGTERIGDVEIVMTRDTGRIEGMVSDAKGEPALGVPVLIFQDDPDRWAAGSPFVRQSRTLPFVSPGPAGAEPAGAGSATMVPFGPRPAGSFMMAGLPAGRYGVVAFPSGTAFLMTDEDLLKKVRPRATVVTVEPGKAATVQLTPIK